MPGSGGPDQVRTDDLLNAIEALFQLSYEPVCLPEGEKNQRFPDKGKEFSASQPNPSLSRVRR